MVMQWEWERHAADKQCIDRALTMWKEWIRKKRRIMMILRAR